MSDIEYAESELHKRRAAYHIYRTGEIWLKLEDPALEIEGREALRKRLHALEMQIAANGGAAGRAAYGDGKRTTAPLTDEVKRGLREALDAKCDREKLARIERMAPGALAYVESGLDVKMSLVRCAVDAETARLDKEDQPPPRSTGKREYRKACGVHHVVFAALHLGAGRFADYALPYGDDDFEFDPPVEIPCSKIPARSKAGREFASAIEDYQRRTKGSPDEVFIVGKPRMFQRNRTWRMVGVAVYSRKMPFEKNICGEGVVCSAAGSPAVTAFEDASHHLQRAAVHRDAGRVDRCKASLEKARVEYERYVSYRADRERTGAWSQQVRYRIAGVAQPLSGEQFTARFKAMGGQIEELRLRNDCAQPR